jgi:hypothetical protein
VVQARRLGRQALRNLAKALQPGELGEKHRLEVPLARPAVVPIPNPMIAPVPRDNPVHRTTVQRFHKAQKSASLERHGRPQNLCLATAILGQNSGFVCRAAAIHHKIPDSSAPSRE